MALTTALFAGLSGLNAHSAKLDVIGNNVANVNTTAFKSSRMLFESLFSQSLGFGTSPSEITGGVNPKQIGNGVGVAGVQRDFSAAGFNGTGDLRDLAIDGSGFFLVQRGGSNYYTRAGTFRQDSDDNLATATGEKLLGYAVDDQFNILTGQLVPINIPVGKQSIAEATRNIALVGNLNKDGDLPTQGSIVNLQGTATAGFSATGGGFITSATLLTGVEDPDLPGSGTPAFAVGQTISFRGSGGATRGGTDLPDGELEITATTTVQDYMDFLESTIGIQDTGAPNPDGNTPGVTVDPLTGIIQIVGNTGETNDLVIAPGISNCWPRTGLRWAPPSKLIKQHRRRRERADDRRGLRLARGRGLGQCDDGARFDPRHRADLALLHRLARRHRPGLCARHRDDGL